MEQTNDMAVQIGKIIANTLVKSQAVYMPEIGSLYVETLPSQINSSSGVMTPPKSVVKYTSQQRGESVVDIISKMGGCDEATSQEIYARWAEGVKSEAGVEIVGVGEIKGEGFTVTSQLDGMLNPEGQKSLQLKKRKSSWIWIVASVVGCVIVGMVANYSTQIFMSGEDKKPQPVVVEQIVEQTVEPVVEQPKPEPKVSANPRYRVVYGVFSTMENAQRASSEAMGISSGVKTNIRPYGEYFMVTLFESEVINDCKAFMDNNDTIYKDMWISKRRGE